MSVLIPTYRRPAKLGACLRALRAQSPGTPSFEVLVGVDGGDEGVSAGAAREAWGVGTAAGDAPGLTVLDLPKGGPGAVRNALAARAKGTITLLLNDDVIPAPDLVRAHAEAQAALASPAFVLGDTPWVVHTPDRLFDQLIRETSMVFFYDRMRADAHDAGRDWGFRHAWTLNLSLPTAVLRERRFLEIDGTYGYDDVEFAWRCGLAVLYRPEAVARHDHRMEPEEYLAREYLLGRTAWVYATRSPEMARALFRRDILAPEEVGETRRLLREGEDEARRLRAWFLRLATRPAGMTPEGVRTLYETHLPLKRWAWRRGLLDAIDGVPSRDVLTLLAPVAAGV